MPAATPRKSASGSPRPKAQRLAAEAELRQATAGTATLTRQQVQALIEECADVARTGGLRGQAHQ
jgi:hypothetical protein